MRKLGIASYFFRYPLGQHIRLDGIWDFQQGYSVSFTERLLDGITVAIDL
jgi:hypothetical protein